MDDSVSRAIVMLKREFARAYKGHCLLREVLPLTTASTDLQIDDGVLQSMHKFVSANPIYVRSYDCDISGIACRVYEGDINNYWLSSKKYDTSYQPFYPTWMLSALALARAAKSLGFERLVDVGSGDGRIAYCGALLGMESHGLEIDHDLVQLQNAISTTTGVIFSAIRADATRFDYGALNLSKPMFFISGLPEMGEMLANSVIKQIASRKELRNGAGVNFMGSHVMKSHSRDQSGWGWGTVIASHDLELAGILTLPTLWTIDQLVDTAYIYTRFRQQ